MIVHHVKTRSGFACHVAVKPFYVASDCASTWRSPAGIFISAANYGRINDMPDFASQMAATTPLTEEQQKRAGQALSGDMDQEHKDFCTTISRLLEKGEINVAKPDTFLNQDVYAKLDPQWKTKTDLNLLNMATLLTHIYGFYKSKQTPDACPQLATMIEQLWEMKQRIEGQGYDVFKF